MSLKLNMGGSSAPREGNGGMVEWSNNAYVYRTPSGSRAGKFHLTFISGEGGAFMCTCEGYQFRGKCKHIDFALAMQLDSQPPAPVEPLSDIDGVDTEAIWEGLPDGKEFGDK